MKNKLTVIALMMFIFFAAAVAPVFAVEQGDDAPAFVLTDTERNYNFSKKMYGNEWILIDFYATWCENCNAELPYVEELYAEFKDIGFNVLLMATDSEGLDVVVPFFKQNPTTVKILIDKYQKASGAFGVEALPTMFLVDKNGKIAFKTVGFHEEDIESLRQILSDNLNG
ncbi:MAG: TlpA disulfide reductase family protein [Spirochaetales bacterium]|uniref:TlpA disulfide reductase family protein n=1 Tax=Candidatus Thalassospirochaeta sargassi TaxID=3119039 RepID=A0AAJ1IFL8_9SPIO|nr:TlpA disulfide reductase family protein [Spirochaetales bacterium]